MSLRLHQKCNCSGGSRGRRLTQLPMAPMGGGIKDGRAKLTGNCHLTVRHSGGGSLEILPKAPETIDPLLPNCVRSIKMFCLCSRLL